MQPTVRPPCSSKREGHIKPLALCLACNNGTPVTVLNISHLTPLSDSYWYCFSSGPQNLSVNFLTCPPHHHYIVPIPPNPQYTSQAQIYHPHAQNHWINFCWLPTPQPSLQRTLQKTAPHLSRLLPSPCTADPHYLDYLTFLEHNSCFPTCKWAHS